MTNAWDPLAGREILLEWSHYGDVARVAAVDAATGEEASAAGPLTAPRADLERIALRKLADKLGLREPASGTKSGAGTDPSAAPSSRPRRGRWA